MQTRDYSQLSTHQMLAELLDARECVHEARAMRLMHELRAMPAPQRQWDLLPTSQYQYIGEPIYFSGPWTASSGAWSR